MKMTHKPAKYEHINPADYKNASPWDLWEEARQKARDFGPNDVSAELNRLAHAKNERMWRDPARMALAYGFDSTAEYLEWCNAVGLGAR